MKAIQFDRRAAKVRVDTALALARSKRTQQILNGINFADGEAVVPGGGGTTLTLGHTPVSDASVQVFRGAADGLALTINWTRSGAVITLGVAQVDVNEIFRVWYRY